MAYLEWEPRLNTGISVIDGQHKRIVNYINKLYDASHQENSKELEISNTIIELIDYTISHFAFEESLLAEAKYEHQLDHNSKHQFFSNKIFEYKKRLESGEDIVEPLLKLLHDWLFVHILKEDAQYVSAVSEYFMDPK